MRKKLEVEVRKALSLPLPSELATSETASAGAARGKK
jgi:hypothetical protein